MASRTSKFITKRGISRTPICLRQKRSSVRGLPYTGGRRESVKFLKKASLRTDVDTCWPQSKDKTCRYSRIHLPPLFVVQKTLQRSMKYSIANRPYVANQSSVLRCPRRQFLLIHSLDTSLPKRFDFVQSSITRRRLRASSSLAARRYTKAYLDTYC